MKYGLIGESGRLGSEVKTVFSENECDLVFNYSLDGENIKEKPEIIIDCSLPDVFTTTLKHVKEFGVPLIIATTGLNNGHFNELYKLAKRVPVIQSFNFSVGIQILLKLTSQINKIVPDWDVEITETHHRFKKDKPSGTAKMIEKVFEDKEINTSSLRLGNVPGDHTVNFGGLGEVLSVSHKAISRRTFAEGIYKSAQFALNAQPGFYSFTDVLFGVNNK